MKKRIIKNRYNSPQTKGYTTIHPSQTIPGETLTIQEIFHRATELGGYQIQAPEAHYLDVEDIEDIDTMYKTGHDLTELQEHAQSIQDLNDKIQTQIQLKNKDKELKAKQAEKDAIIKAHNDELNDKKAKNEQPN